MAFYFRVPFGTSGDRTAIPVTGTATGPINYTYGYGTDYSLPRLTDPAALNVERVNMNQLFYDITDNIQQYQEHGVPEFITAADNGGLDFEYDAGAIVRYNNGVTIENYISLVDSNDELPTNTSFWSQVSGAALVTATNSVTLTNKTLTSPTITGGTINNAVIGGTTPAAATFTNLVSTTGITVNSGGITVTAASVVAASFVPTGSSAPANGVYLPSANTVGISCNSTLVATLTSTGLNNTVIGATTPLAGTFTSATANAFIPNSSSIPSDGLYLPASNTPSIAARSLKALEITNPASSVNYWNLTGSIATANPALSVLGSDTNIALDIKPKGTGTSNLWCNGAPSFRAGYFSGSGSPVNFITVNSVGAGFFPIIHNTDSSDTNPSLIYLTKGTGTHLFSTGGPSGTNGVNQFRITHTASSVNYIGATGGVTGSPGTVTLFAGGSDSDVDIALTPKGTGVLKFGTRTAIAAETVTGYITIKDSGGTSRKLAVVS